WLKEEVEAIGEPFEKRGSRADEHVAAMRALWAKDDASYEGQFVSFKGMSVNPKPVAGRIPIHIGGHSEAAARRAAKLGDGFFPATGSPVDIGPLIDRMRQMAAENDRDPASIEVTTGCPGALPGSGTDAVAAVMDAKRRGVGRVVLPVTAFMSGAQQSATQHARTFGGLSADGLEERLAEFGETVIRKANG
ncbi:MAG: LLM class flavin-dependent oxidoreductase, partial [Hyphomicrobiaceae bacterium]